MVKLGLGFVTIALLVGCSSKEDISLMDRYEKKQNFYKYLQKTEKVQFKENNVTKLLITVTYMNKATVDLDDTSEETFLVGLHNEGYDIKAIDSEELSIQLHDRLTKEESRAKRDEKRALRKARREKLELLRLEDTNASLPEDENLSKKTDMYLDPIDIKRVDKESSLLQGISFVSDWTQYYLLRFKHIAGNRLTLKIKSKKSEAELALDREKAAKILAKKKKKKSTYTKKKKKKVKLYNIKTLSFAKVAKYAL